MPNQLTSKFIQFNNPVELLTFYDVNFLNEIHKLYPWQVEILLRFSQNVPLDNMLRMAVIAANGSGKSQFVLAPAITWMPVAFEESLAYVTSSSASQLDTQTERFIDYLANKMNTQHEGDFGGEPVWKIIRRHKEFYPNKSYIDLFATDEPKKAEGKHPLVPNGEFAIFIDEGKSIEPDIYGAIDRCTGATRRLDVSSAGASHGHFYDVCTNPELGWWTRRITYKDCPHIKEHEFLQAVHKYGLNDPLVRSIFFSEFSSADEAIVLRRDTIEECQKKFKSVINFTPIRAGIDLAGGGDELVMSIWQGNVMLGYESNRFKDTDQGVQEIIHWQHKWGIENKNIWIENDGFNQGIVDNLRGRGHNYNKVQSGGRAFNDKRYANRQTELWFEFKRYVEEGLCKLVDDAVLKTQLSSRYYARQPLTDRIKLESKQEARKKGHPSPDRADACVFAWAGCPTIDEFIKQHQTEIIIDTSKIGKQFKEADYIDFVENQLTYADNPEAVFKSRAQLKGLRKANNSLSCIPNITSHLDDWAKQLN
jgi:phage terminase large subunit